MLDPDTLEVSVEQEVADVSVGRCHVVLLGAGASKAALPEGDRSGRPIPLLAEVAEMLDLGKCFPSDLQELASADFEAAFSRLFDRRDADRLAELESAISEYFRDLALPDSPNLYDVLLLSLREKDAVFTFNWDPFLVQSYRRLSRIGVRSLPWLYFLHGNVLVGYCQKDMISGFSGARCSTCLGPFVPTRLLFPVEKKNYQDGSFIEREWAALQQSLDQCFMFTIFGYSAPTTDVEALSIMKAAWGDVSDRRFEQTEIINRPGADHDALRATWDPFIHTHHYEIHESFYDSWLAKHPRRSGEAYKNQYIMARFISDNPVPRDATSLAELVAWFEPLFVAENGAE